MVTFVINWLVSKLILTSRSKNLLKLKTLVENFHHSVLKTHVLKDLSFKQVVKICTLLLIFNFYLGVYSIIYISFLIYYAWCVKKLDKWEVFKPLIVENYSKHEFVGLFLVIPNAMAFQTLATILERYNTAKIHGLGLLLVGLGLRWMLGFPPFLLAVIEVFANSQLPKNKPIFYQEWYNLYSKALHNYHFGKIIRIGGGFLVKDDIFEK